MDYYYCWFCFLFRSCAPVGMTKEEYGFLYGIVHGFISPFVLIAKLLGANIGLYAEHNIGSLYWLGFILGVVLGGGGGTYSTRKEDRMIKAEKVKVFPILGRNNLTIKIRS